MWRILPGAHPVVAGRMEPMSSPTKCAGRKVDGSRMPPSALGALGTYTSDSSLRAKIFGCGSGFATQLSRATHFEGAQRNCWTHRRVLVVASLHAMHAMQCNAGRIGWVQCAMSATKQSRSRGWCLQRQACAHWWTCNANARRATHFGRFWEFRCKACGSAEVSTPPTFGAEISTPNVSGAIKTATLRCLLCDLRDSVVQFFWWRLCRAGTRLQSPAVTPIISSAWGLRSRGPSTSEFGPWHSTCPRTRCPSC